jgi:hypothetical protein
MNGIRPMRSARCAASLIETYAPFEKHIPKDVLYHDVSSRYERTVNRRFQPISPLWPSAVSDKIRPPWDTHLRRRWFRTESGPFVEVDISSSQTQVLAYLLGDTELERITGSQSFNAFLAELAWTRSRRSYRGTGRFQFRQAVHKDDVYKDADDPRLLALVKQTWMRTLYGSQPWAIVRDQAASVEEYGQGWDCENLSKFLKAVPGWKTVGMFLKACQAIGSLEEHQCGITMRDPFDRVEFQWAPAWRQPKPLSTRGAKRGFTFSIDVPRYDVATGGFRVEKRKMRDCIAPRTVHMLDAALNALVIEQVATLCRSGAFPLVAVHDAWLMAQIDDAAVDPDVIPVADTTAREVQEEFLAAVQAAKAAGSDTVTLKRTHLRALLEQAIDKNELDAADGPLNVTVVRGAWILRWALDRAAKEWFTSLEPVYDDLIRLLAGTEYELFAHGIKATWRKRLDACQGGTAPWPTFRAKTV